MYTGQLRAAGLAKEVTVGTLVTPPTEFLPIYPGDTFFPSIALLEATGIRALPDVVYKTAQGKGEMKSGKVKWEAEGENIGNLLMGTFGTDTPAEVASFIVTNANNKIDFKENGGTTRNATIANATYAMGASSAVNGSLCKAVKTALEAAAGATLTYTVTYSFTTKKMTITASSTTVQILWLTGANNANAAYAVLGWTKADTSAAIAITSDSTTSVAVWGHTFTRLSNAQLPSYSWWFDKGAKFPQFTGCMVNKLDLACKAGDFLMADSDWVAQGYDDTGSSKAPSYSAVPPFKFDQLVVKLDTTLNLNYESVKVSFDNMVQADHVLNSSIYPGKIYSKGFRVTVNLDLVVEDTTQYAKFLGGTQAALNLAWTSAADISGAASGNKYALTLDISSMAYSVASYPIAPGLIKVAFTGVGVYNVGNTKTINAVLQNSVATSY